MEAANRDLTSLLYRGLTGHDFLAQFLHEFSSTYGATHSSLTIRNRYDHSVSEVIHHGYDDSEFNDYAQYFYKKCVWSDPLYDSLHGHFHVTDAFLSDRQFTKTEFYNDFAKHVGIRHGSGAVIDIPRTDNYLQVASLRGSDERHYEKSDFHFMDTLIPHLQQTLSLRSEFCTVVTTSRDTEDLINQSNFAVILCDERKRILYHNSFAQIFFEKEAPIKERKGEVSLTNRRQNNLFRQCIFDATKTALYNDSAMTGGAFVTNHRSINYEIRITPFRYRNMGMLSFQSIPCAAIIIKQQKAFPSISPTTLSGLYGLTKAEADITIMLVSGRTPDEITRIRKTSIQTVRTQIRTIYQKTEVDNYLDLSARLLLGVAVN